jgi:hypothetical protein
MADAVPPQVAAAAQTADLGELQGVYTVTSNLLLAFLWWGYAAIVGPSGLVSITAGLGSDSATRKTITLLLGVVLTLCAAAMIWRGMQIIRNRKLYLYKRGVVYTHPSGRAKWFGAWQDVQVYWGQGNTRNSEGYRIVFPQGGKVRWGLITFYRDAKILTEGVGAQARKLSAAHKTPIALKRLHAGETLEFGPLLVDVQGVIGKGKDFAWPEVTSVVLLGRISLVIHATKKRRIGTPLDKVSDLNVLLRVIEAARSA